MPTFCRHNRFIERCPICSTTLPGAAGGSSSSRRRREAGSPGTAAPGAGHPSKAAARRRAAPREEMRVRRELRSSDDGYRSALVPGVRSTVDAVRLAHEIAFASARIAAFATDPPGLYGEIRQLAREGELESASWACFLTSYLSPHEDAQDPFADIRSALAGAVCEPLAQAQLEQLSGGPRGCHDPARAAQTLKAYCAWAAAAGGQRAALEGEGPWTPERRFERLLERLALPGFARACRYELLVLLGRLGVCELRASSLGLAGTRGAAGPDGTALAAKRVFGIGDPLLLERRAASLAQAADVPLESLDLGLYNWAAPARATLGFPAQTGDEAALARVLGALGL